MAPQWLRRKDVPRMNYKRFSKKKQENNQVFSQNFSWREKTAACLQKSPFFD